LCLSRTNILSLEHPVSLRVSLTPRIISGDSVKKYRKKQIEKLKQSAVNITYVDDFGELEPEEEGGEWQEVVCLL